MVEPDKEHPLAKRSAFREHVGRVNLNLLVIFRAVARRGSVTLAAEDLALSQPAVSHALNRFRDIVKDPLFLRTGKDIVLTPRAESILTKVSPALATIEEAVGDASFDPGSDERRFQIGCCEYGSSIVLPKFFAFMRKEAPHCSVKAVPAGGSSLDDLLAGKIDFLLCGNPIDAARFQYSELFEEHFVIVVSSNHPLIEKYSSGQLNIDNYLAYSHARFTSFDGAGGPIDRVLANFGRKRTVTYCTTDAAAILDTVKQTDIVAALPSRLVSLYSPEGIVRLRLPLYVPPLTYKLVLGPRVNFDPATRWLHSRILSECQSPTFQAAA